MRKTMRVTSVGVLLLMGCATNAQTGAVGGAAGGAVVGGVIGKVAGSTAKGAIIGAAVGGTAGALIGAKMDRQAKELEVSIKGATVERVGEGIQVTFASGLLFGFDSDVPSADAKVNLRELALIAPEVPRLQPVDPRPHRPGRSSTYNQGLSERRASAVDRYLTQQGVAGSRMSTRGLGETEPIATNSTEAGRQANRRVEVSIYAVAGSSRRRHQGDRRMRAFAAIALLLLTACPGTKPIKELLDDPSRSWQECRVVGEVKTSVGAWAPIRLTTAPGPSSSSARPGTGPRGLAPGSAWKGSFGRRSPSEPQPVQS